VEPFAFGTRLRLHPLAVLLTVTTATMLFGVIGAVLAAPLTSACVNAFGRLRSEGILGSAPPPATDDVRDAMGAPPPGVGDVQTTPTDDSRPEVVQTP